MSGRSRWNFPMMECVTLDVNGGTWSDTDFHNAHVAESSSEQIPVTWYRAEPTDLVTDSHQWEDWLNYLRTDANAAEGLLRVAIARAVVVRRKLEATKAKRAGERT
jgi:hypothetical protein